MLEGLMTPADDRAILTAHYTVSVIATSPTPVESVTGTAVPDVEWDSHWASFAFHTARD